MKTYGYVAFIDILGFSELISRGEFEKTFERYRRSIVEATQRSERLKYAVFSDLILLYTTHNRRGADRGDFLTITEACSMLLHSFLSRGIPLRGCLSYGDFHVGSKGSHGTVIAGRPILEAYKGGRP